MTAEELLSVPPLIKCEKAAVVTDALFPDVDAAELRYLGSGTLYDVYLTVDGWAFRSPAGTGPVTCSSRRHRPQVRRAEHLIADPDSTRRAPRPGVGAIPVSDRRP
jgi:hypothetical protein